MTASVCSERQLSKTRDTDVSNSSHQWIQKWFLKTKGPVSGLLKLYYLLCKQHLHRDQTHRHCTSTGKTQDLFPMGNSNILWKALFRIGTTRRNLEISRTKDIGRGVGGWRQRSPNFLFLNETEEMIAPSSGAFSACFITPRDFARSPCCQWDLT